MKIGIITFWTSKDNYGQILQCYALQQYLRNKGHQPFLIRYTGPIGKKASFKLRNLYKYIIKFPTYFSLLINERNSAKYEKSVVNKNRHFDLFIKDNITCTEEIYTSDSIMINPPKADAYICGSDQIWGGDWAYYLDFAPDNKPKIAYAASLGGITSFSPDYENKMKELLKRFDFIGMREQSGVDVCHRLGRKDAIKVVDPTLLLDKSDYDKIRKSSKGLYNKPYILAYILGNPMICDIKEIYKYAQKIGLEVKYVTSGKADNKEHIYPQIGEWIDLIANAEMVITNSFHGTVFSLIYNKPFITIPLKNEYSRMNTRVFELLDAVQLNDHIYNGNFSILEKNISFLPYQEYCKRQQYFSYIHICKILSKKNEHNT